MASEDSIDIGENDYAALCALNIPGMTLIAQRADDSYCEIWPWEFLASDSVVIVYMDEDEDDDGGENEPPLLPPDVPGEIVVGPLPARVLTVS